MSLIQILLEKQNLDNQNTDQLELKAIQSKIKNLNDTLEILVQKKIRLDLEIQRTRKKLSKMKKLSSTKLSASLSLESLEVDPETIVNLLSEIQDKEFLNLVLSLDQEIDRAEKNESEVERLPLFEDRI